MTQQEVIQETAQWLTGLSAEYVTLFLQDVPPAMREKHSAALCEALRKMGAMA